MSRQNVEVVEALFAAWEQRNAKAAAELIDPDIEVDLTDVSNVPAAAGQGREGLERVIADWLEVWGSLDFEPQNFIDAGDNVIVLVTATGKGSESGALTEMQLAVVYTVKDGRLVGFRGYNTLAAAANAADV